MAAADVTALERLRNIVVALFPWLARIGLAPSGALQIKSAVARVEIEGAGPAAARVGDATDGGGLALYAGIPGSVPPVLWYTSSQKAPYVWNFVEFTPATGPLPDDAGTRIAGVVTTGSEKVKVG